MTSPVNPNGTTNYQSLLTGLLPSSGSTDVDASTGQPTLWNISKKIRDKTLWFGDRTTASGPFYDTGGGLSQPRKQYVHPVGSAIHTKVIDIYKHYGAMVDNDNDGFKALQRQLAAGPFGKVKVNGSFDDATQKALSDAITQYVDATGNGAGQTFTDFLANASQRAWASDPEHAPGGSKAAGHAPKPPAPPPALQLNLQDPEAIKAAAQAAAQQALGQGLSDDQLNAFVTQFQQQQTSSQTSSYNDQLSNTAGSTTQQDLSSDAMQFAQGAEPGEYQQNQRQSFLNALVNLAAPSGSQRPNMTPTASVGGTGG